MLRPSESSTEEIKVRIFVPVLLFLVFSIASFSSVWTGINCVLYDEALRLKTVISPGKVTSRIVFVDLTDSAEMNLGTAVDNRQAFLDALRVMNKTDCVGGFDFLFSGEKNSAVDDLLAETVGKSKNCVMAVVPLSKAETNFSGKRPNADESAILRKQLWFPHIVHSGRIPVAETFLMPYRNLVESVPLFGHAGLSPDSDGIQRKVPLLYRWENGYLPSLPLAVASDALNVDISRIVLDAGKKLVLPLKDGRKINIPIDSRGCMYVPYTGLWKRGPERIPLDKFLKAAYDQNTFDRLFEIIDDNILWFSDLTTEKKDFGTTPLETVYPLSGIHSSVLNAILTNTFFSSWPFSVRLFTVFFLLAGVLFALRQSKDFRFHCFFISLVCLFSAENIFLWFLFGFVPWYGGMCTAICIAWISSWIFRLSSSYRKRILMEHALSQYFPRSLAVRVMKEKRTDLAPAKKELTMLFSDIEGFTRWSSDKKPETVHAFLSNYLTEMAEIVFAHGGTVDKFIGDGVLAFFGDPLELPDHTERAVRTAIDMQRRIRELAEKWKPLVGIDLKVRIGINTGDVIVGNLGSDIRIDYTVIGSAVNLASRMESNAPAGGILVAEPAWLRVKDLFTFSKAISVKVKGFDMPINAYTVQEESLYTS